MFSAPLSVGSHPKPSFIETARIAEYPDLDFSVDVNLNAEGQSVHVDQPQLLFMRDPTSCNAGTAEKPTLRLSLLSVDE
jgi:hypothetical protein